MGEDGIRGCGSRFDPGYRIGTGLENVGEWRWRGSGARRDEW